MCREEVRMRKKRSFGRELAWYVEFVPLIVELALPAKKHLERKETDKNPLYIPRQTSSINGHECRG